MALEALASNDPSSYICKDLCISNSTSTQQLASTISNNFFFQNNRALLSLPVFPGLNAAGLCANLDYYSYMLQSSPAPEKSDGGLNSSEHQQSRKKRRKRTRMCKNKEEAESQRMTHIAVERNRRKQMNEHLAMLRSLMPESYVQRGDQASIVGGAIDFVKELEQLLQSLEAQKQTRQQRGTNNINNNSSPLGPFAQFFAFPHHSSYQIPGKFPEENRSEIADIEVTMIETHANLRILSQKRPGQLLKMVTGFHNLRLTVLHLNVTTLDPMVLYSFSAKVEEDCYLKSVDDIALAVRHMLRIIDEEAGLMS